MFAYNPTVNDTSGQILGQGITGSAETKANAQVKMVDDIGGALVGLAGAYGEMSEKNAMGDSAYEALGAIGEMYPGMKSTFGALGKLDDRTRRLASLSILDNLGAVSQLGIAGMNNQTRVAQQGLTAAMPGIREGAENNAAVAGGLRTYSPPPLQNVVPPPTPVGFGNINQGMPGSSPMPASPIGTRPMAVRPTGGI